MIMYIHSYLLSSYRQLYYRVSKLGVIIIFISTLRKGSEEKRNKEYCVKQLCMY